jgi:hypothetical protein
MPLALPTLAAPVRLTKRAIWLISCIAKAGRAERGALAGGPSGVRPGRQAVRRPGFSLQP